MRKPFFQMFGIGVISTSGMAEQMNALEHVAEEAGPKREYKMEDNRSFESNARVPMLEHRTHIPLTRAEPLHLTRTRIAYTEKAERFGCLRFNQRAEFRRL